MAEAVLEEKDSNVALVMGKVVEDFGGGGGASYGFGRIGGRAVGGSFLWRRWLPVVV